MIIDPTKAYDKHYRVGSGWAGERRSARGATVRDLYFDGDFTRVEALIKYTGEWVAFPENGLIPEGAFDE